LLIDSNEEQKEDKHVNDISLEEKVQEENMLFEGKQPLRKVSCCGWLLFSWVNPLIKYTNKHKKLKIELYGDLNDNHKVEPYILKLEQIWNK